jgi:hypothetical protein|nr:MAG TPA: hypothetical protein [Caudoviricetes sp.]DAO84989.1 MAG TPA: hypothetical protein [Caudoviricetes sp.]
MKERGSKWKKSEYFSEFFNSSYMLITCLLRTIVLGLCNFFINFSQKVQPIKILSVKLPERSLTDRM